MMWLAFVVVAVVFAGVLIGRRHLSRRALIGAGIAFALVGLVPVAALEWYFSTARTTLVTMPVPMDRAGTIHAGPFQAAIGGEYEMWLVFDHADESADFDCWIGYHDMEAECPRGAPPLDLAWSVVAAGGAPVAEGGTDWRAWIARQARVDPATAARKRKDFLAYQARTADPSNRWPLYYSLGTFVAQEQARYMIGLTLRRPAGPLAALHPKLVVGLSAAATKGLGTVVTILALLWVLAGAAIALVGVARKAPA